MKCIMWGLKTMARGKKAIENERSSKDDTVIWHSVKFISEEGNKEMF